MHTTKRSPAALPETAKGAASDPAQDTSSMGAPSVIKADAAQPEERGRRRRELFFAALILLMVLAATWLELSLFGGDSYLVLILFNINLILLLVVLFVVLRNGIKLLLDRRRRVLGSHLRTRLVLAFMGLALVPTALMFIATFRVLETSIDYWFKNQVDSALESALEVGQSFYTAAAERLDVRAQTVLSQVRERGLAWGGQRMDALFDQKRAEYGLALIGVISANGNDQNWHAADSFNEAWPDVRGRISWEQARLQGHISLLWKGSDADYVIGVTAVDEGRTGYLIVAENIGEGLMHKLEGIVSGFEEYKRLKTLKDPLQASFLFILGMLSLVIILAAIWVGFRLSRELIAPILALAEGTQRVARGDLVQLEDHSTDELSLLIRSFNSMAADLAASRVRLTETNELLEQRNQYIEAVLDTIGAGVISLDPSGGIATMNKAARTICGLEGNTENALISDIQESEEYHAMVTLMEDGVRKSADGRWQHQISFQREDREWRLLLTAVRLDDESGQHRGIVAVLDDVTELERMQRMAAWREVARRIAHEIKNPLTPIKLSAQRLARKFGQHIDDPAFIQSTSLIVSQVEKLQDMVQEFSAFAKLPEVNPVPGSIAPLLHELATLFRTTHPAVQWDIRIEDPLPQLPLDAKAMHRVFLNILTNATEALDGVAQPHISMVARHIAARHSIRVDIADNGPGLTAEERSRLFEPYFSRKSGGTGLGLTIVRSLVADHHGYVRAQSLPEGGTLITIELPLEN